MNYKDAKDSTGQSGLEFQDWIADMCWKDHRIVIQNYSSRKYQFERGENPQGYEIKEDSRCVDSGRLSIEIAEKKDKEQQTFRPSGIYASPGSVHYIQGYYQIVFMFITEHLVKLHKSGLYESKEDATIRAFYLPFAVAVQVGVVLFGDPSKYMRTRPNVEYLNQSFEQLFLPILADANGCEPAQVNLTAPAPATHNGKNYYASGD